ncbi:MAG TPA: PEGA domain-containing protein [Tepidisphaeraceae bacterium]|nr:PEGA domain-containing protein [Tepidisphaeraceae bacterium]
MKSLVLFALGVLGFFSTGCATLVTGGGHTQTVQFKSEPAGATIYVDNNRIGVTPVAAPLIRSKDHTVRVELAGYPTQTRLIKTGFNGAILGNILIGGVPGLLVDLISGSMEGVNGPQNIDCKFGPEQDPTKWRAGYTR